MDRNFKDMDIAALVGAVDREVVDREHDGRPAHAVVATRTYDAPIDDVWDALTDPERIPRWFLPVSGDLRLGGRYQLEGNAGGEITACEPPRHLAVTWVFDETVSWLDVQLAADADDPDGTTRLRLEHIVPDNDHWDEFGPGAIGVGWDLTLVGLGRHLQTGEAVNADGEFETWFATPEGKDVLRLSSDDWCRAAIAPGTPKDVAEARAARTFAAYTGAGPTGEDDPAAGSEAGAEPAGDPGDPGEGGTDPAAT